MFSYIQELQSKQNTKELKSKTNRIITLICVHSKILSYDTASKQKSICNIGDFKQQFFHAILLISPY